jgi:hypothetical protein
MTDINSNNPKSKRAFPKVPDEAIVKPEEEKPVESTITPDEVESKDELEYELEYEQMKSADHDMDGDDNPDIDPEET